MLLRPAASRFASAAALLLVLALLALLPAAPASAQFFNTSMMELLTLAAPWSARQNGGLLILNTPLPATSPSSLPMSGGSMVAPAPGHMLLYGGIRTPSGGATSDVWYSTTQATTFSALNITTGFGYDSEGYGPATCIDKRLNILYSIAGDAANNRDGDSTFWASTNLGQTWTQASGPFIGRVNSLCFVDSTSRVYLIGGKWASPTGNDVSNDVWTASLTSTNPLTLSWTQISAVAPFSERDAPAGDSYYSSRLQTDVLYQTTGYVYNSIVALNADEGTGTNDVWASVDRGASWTLLTNNAAFPPRYRTKLLTTKDGVLVVVGGSHSEPPSIVNGQLVTTPSFTRNDMWASLDGGLTWGRCVDLVFPLYNNLTTPSSFARGTGRADPTAAIDPLTGILYVGSGLQRDTANGKVAVSDMLRTRFSFHNIPAVAASCGLTVPSVIGLRDLTPFITSSTSYTLSSNPNASRIQVISTNAAYTARQNGGLHFVINSNINISTIAGYTVAGPSSFVVYGGYSPTLSGAGALLTDAYFSSSLGGSFSRINMAATYTFEAYGPTECSDQTRNILYMIGGDQANNRDGDSIIWASTDLGQTWTMSNAPFIGRTNAACTVDSTSRIYLVAGKWAATVGNDVSNDVWMAEPSASSSPLTFTWTLVSAAAPFTERDTPSIQSYYSPRLQTDVLYMTTGYIYIDATAAAGDRGTGTNDVWVSVDRGVSWTMLTMAAFPPRYRTSLLSTNDGVLVIVGGSQNEPPPPNTPTQGNSYVRNDMWASLDGGYTWGLCFNQTFPLWSSYTNASQFARGSGRADALAALDPNTGVLYVGGGLGRQVSGSAWGPTDFIRSTFSFFNLTEVATACSLTIPASIGLTDLTPFIASHSSYIPLSSNSTFLQTVTLSAPWLARREAGLHIVRNATAFSVATTRGFASGMPSSFIVFGGLAPGSGSVAAITNDVWYSASLGGAFSKVNMTSSFTTLGYGVATCSDTSRNILYSIGGGTSNDQGGTSQVWMSSNLGQSWSLSTAPFPGRTNALCLVDSASRVYVMGGKWASTSGTDVSNDVWVGTLSTSTSPYSLTWTQASAAAPFSERDGLAGATYYSSRLGADVVYMSTGYVYTGALSEREDDGTGTNDVWVSTNGGATWGTLGNATFPPRYHSKMLATKDGVLVLISGEQDEPAVVTNGQITQAPAYMRNDMWASMDGGVTWGMCSNQTFPAYNGVSASLITRGLGRQDTMAAIDPNTGVLYMGSGLQYNTAGSKVAASDFFRSTISFHNLTAVSRACNLAIPAIVGLATAPTAVPGTLPSSTGSASPATRPSSSVASPAVTPSSSVASPVVTPSSSVAAVASSSSSSTGVTAASTSSSDSLSGGAIAGIVIGAIVAVALILAFIVFRMRSSKSGSLGASSRGAAAARHESHSLQEESVVEMEEVQHADDAAAEETA